MSALNQVFKCLWCDCELDDTVVYGGAYCNKCLYDDDVTVVKEETEEICQQTCAVCNRVEQLNDLCLCSKCYKEHLHFAVDESEDVEDSDTEQDLIDAQHAEDDNAEYTEEENAEYFRLNPQPPLERKCCETLKENSR